MISTLNSSLILAQAFEIKKKTQPKDESTKTYIQRFNKEMFKLERVLEFIATRVLINRVYNYYLWERLYTLLKQNLFNIKHTMENYIKVKKASPTR